MRFLATALLLAGCRAELSVGAPPDAGSDASTPPSPCSATTGTLATLDPSLSVRALASDGARLYIAAATPDGAGTLAALPIPAGGAPSTLAAIGGVPTAIATDNRGVYVSSAARGEVTRVAKANGASVIIAGQPGASALAADGIGNAFWTVTSPAGTVRRSRFDSSQAASVAVASATPTAITTDGNTLFVAGPGSVTQLSLAEANAISTVLAPRCDGAAIAFTGSAVLCSEGSTLVAIPTDGAPVWNAAHFDGVIREIVVADGRAFVRAGPGSIPVSQVYALTLDDFSLTLVWIPNNAAMLTADRCNLYYAVDATLGAYAL